MALSDQLVALSNQAKELETSVQAIQDRNCERVRVRKAALETSIKNARSDIKAANAEAVADGDLDWAETKASVSDAFETARARSEDRRTIRSANRADRAADRSEDDASDAIDYAMYAIEEAEWAVLDAADARAVAEARDATRP